MKRDAMTMHALKADLKALSAAEFVTSMSRLAEIEAARFLNLASLNKMPTKAKKPLRFEYWKSVKNKQWYWRIRAGNGEPISNGEGYKSMRGVLKVFDLLFNFEAAPVCVDLNAEAVAKFRSAVRGFPPPKKLAKKPKNYEGPAKSGTWP